MTDVEKIVLVFREQRKQERMVGRALFLRSAHVSRSDKEGSTSRKKESGKSPASNPRLMS